MNFDDILFVYNQAFYPDYLDEHDNKIYRLSRVLEYYLTRDFIGSNCYYLNKLVSWLNCGFIEL